MQNNLNGIQTKEWLIAHRGARCDGRENTLIAFKACKNYPLGWVELDVHTTKDGVVICHHDFDVNGLDIDLCTFEELRKADPELTTFKKAIGAIGKTPIIVEIKPKGTAKNIVKILNDHPKWIIASYKQSVIKELINLKIYKKRLYLLQHKHNFGHIRKAKKLGVGGVGINKIYVPFIYPLARLHKLNAYTYTLNNPFVAKIYRKLYKNLAICTDRPDKLQGIK